MNKKQTDKNQIIHYMPRWGVCNLLNDSSKQIKLNLADGAYHKVDYYININSQTGKNTLYVYLDKKATYSNEDITLAGEGLGDFRFRFYKQDEVNCSYSFKNMEVNWSDTSLLPTNATPLTYNFEDDVVGKIPPCTNATGLTNGSEGWYIDGTDAVLVADGVTKEYDEGKLFKRIKLN